MTIVDLIEEYKSNAAICSRIDYNDRKTVGANNRAVKRMYEILSIIITDFGKQGVAEFSKLIDCETDYVNLWASIQLLERATVESDIERKALSVIREEAQSSLGHQYWLKSYFERKYGT
jgi:hypothetical protein